MKKLRSIHIDTEKGIYQLNGEDIGSDTSRLRLEFENGEWSLEVTRDSYFTANDRELQMSSGERDPDTKINLTPTKIADGYVECNVRLVAGQDK